MGTDIEYAEHQVRLVLRDEPRSAVDDEARVRAAIATIQAHHLNRIATSLETIASCVYPEGFTVRRR